MNQRRLDHALHNEDVCEYLFKDGKYNDWVITTAFYSSLHFVQCKIFSISSRTDDGKVFKVQTLEEYINTVCRPSDTDNKHKVLQDLVKKYCFEISSQYRQLKDLSWTARYSGYRYERNIAELAVKRLKAIKLFCMS